MIAEEEARRRILERIRPLPSLTVRLTDAVDRFAAENYVATVPLPAFDNSAMDGYAVMASSCGGGGQLRITGEQPAGVDRQLRVSDGEAIRIFTGAPIPSGADAVIMQEDVTRAGDQIAVNTNVRPGEFIRRRGCDLAEGQRLLAKGQRIRTTTVALLASQGLREVAVGGEVEAAIISTGDELIPIGQPLRPGEIYDSNSVLLQTLLERIGAIVAAVEHCEDHYERLKNAIRRAASHHLLVLSGGVSVGEHDLVRSALESLGGEIDLWRVAIKPGKPFLFGRLANCAVFGLPGNPVSAFVTLLQFVRPAILKMMGAAPDEVDLPRAAARLGEEIKNDGERTHYIRGKLEQGTFTPVGRQESHALFGLSRSNALLRVEANGQLHAGTPVEVQVWD